MHSIHYVDLGALPTADGVLDLGAYDLRTGDRTLHVEKLVRLTPC